MATKCLKINDSISNPTSTETATGVVCVAVAAEGFSKEDGTKDLGFNIRMMYFLNEASYDAFKQPLMWDNLPVQCEVNITEAEWDGADTSPKYGNDLIYSKVKDWFVSSDVFTNVVEIAKV